MKTEMKIKKREAWTSKTSGRRRNGQRNLSPGQAAACFALLCLLAAGGYIGASVEPVKMTAAPVAVRDEQYDETLKKMTMQEILKKQENDRREEIALLDSIITSPAGSDETKNSALKQKTELVSRMETESSVRTGLMGMGYQEPVVLCSAGQIFVVLADENALKQEAAVRIVDAAAAFAKTQAQNVKIILVKK